MPLYGVANFDNIKKLLSLLEICHQCNALPYCTSQEDRSIIRHQSYKDRYIRYYVKKYYSFILKDLSLIGFESSDTGYYYFQTPFTNLKYYLDKYNLYDDDFIQHSDFMLDELENRNHPFYLRYDYSEDQYKEGQHPAAHIHLGVDSPIRLSCKYKLKPMSFILFVLRQFYPDEWTRLLTYGENIPEVNVALKSVRDNLEPISTDFLSGWNLHEMHLE